MGVSRVGQRVAAVGRLGDGRCPREQGARARDLCRLGQLAVRRSSRRGGSRPPGASTRRPRPRSTRQSRSPSRVAFARCWRTRWPGSPWWRPGSSHMRKLCACLAPATMHSRTSTAAPVEARTSPARRAAGALGVRARSRAPRRRARALARERDRVGAPRPRAAQAPRARLGKPHPNRATGRGARRARTDKSANRRADVHLSGHRQGPPLTHLRQARHRNPRRARGRSHAPQRAYLRVSDRLARGYRPYAQHLRVPDPRKSDVSQRDRDLAASRQVDGW
jgi:hypothetical protein